MATRRAAASKFRFQAPVRTVRPIVHDEETAPLSSSRLDGRQSGQLRRLFFRTGANAQASGSAYGECGATKILVAVFGPRPSRLPRFIDQAVLKCDFRFTTFASAAGRRSHQPGEPLSTADEELAIALRQSLEVVVRLERYPKSTIDVNVLVLEDDGGALALATSLASLALVDAGVEVVDVVSAVTVGVARPVVRDGQPSSAADDDSSSSSSRGKKTLYFLDPTLAEMKQLRGSITVASTSTINEVVQFLQAGELSAAQADRAVQLALDGCAATAQLLKQALLPPPTTTTTTTSTS